MWRQLDDVALEQLVEVAGELVDHDSAASSPGLADPGVARREERDDLLDGDLVRPPSTSTRSRLSAM